MFKTEPFAVNLYKGLGGWYINSLLIIFFRPRVFIKNFATFFESEDSSIISISSSFSSSSAKSSYVNFILSSVICYLLVSLYLFLYQRR